MPALFPALTSFTAWCRPAIFNPLTVTQYVMLVGTEAIVEWNPAPSLTQSDRDPEPIREKMSRPL
jgi:hypothetical protein